MAKSNIIEDDLHLKLIKVSEGVEFEEKSGEIVLRGLKDESYISVGIQEYYDEYQKLEEEKDTIVASSSKTKQKQLDDNAKKKQALKDFFSDVIYVNHLVGNGLNLTSKDCVGSEGNVSVQIETKPFLSGGGKFYVEAFHRDRQPRLTSPYGIFFSARGEEKIIRTAWSDCSMNPIDDVIKFGSTVLLHVYTENLYGQELDIELWDKDWFIVDSNDPLYEKKDGKQFLDREGEINLYKYEASIDGSSEMSNGNLTSSGQSTDKVLVSILHVQKGIWLVKIHESWGVTAGNNLKIFPLVKDKQGKYFEGFDRKFLQVEANATKFCSPPPTGKSPVSMGQVNTNPGAFKPCYYTYIKAKVNELPEIILFSENESSNLIDEYILPLTAGVVHKQSQLKIELNTDTSNCLYETSSPEHIHKGKVIDLSQFPKFAPYGSVTGDFIKWDPEDVFSGGKVKEANDEVKVSSTFKVPGGGEVKISDTLKILESPSDFKVQAKDSFVALYVGYDYTNWGRQSPIIGLFKAIWPNNERIAQRYPVKIHTCRYPSKTVYIDVYPDIKWTLQLGFNYDAQQFEKVKKQYHENWQLTGESYKSKSRRNDLNRKQKKEFKEEAEKAMAKSEKNITGALLNPKTAIAGDIVEFQIGMIAELDGGQTKIEAKDLFPEITDFLKKVFDIIKKVDEIIDGEDEQAKKDTELEMHPDREEKLRKRVKAKKGVKHSVSFSFIPPEIGLSVSWEAERPEDVDKPLMGTTFTGKIEANPLFGYKMKLDILDLLGKSVPHPAVKAAIMLMQFLDDIAGDNFDINFDLIVKGEVKLEGEGKVSTLKNSHVGSKSPFKLEGVITIEIKANITVQGKTDTFFFGTVGAYGKLAGDVTTGITFAGSIEAQTEGLFLIPSIEFHGIILNGEAKAGLVAVENPGKDKADKMDLENEPGVHVGVEGQIIAMQAYEWEITEWKIPIMRNKY